MLVVTRYLGCNEENRAELAVAEMLKLLDKWEGKIAVRTVVILLQFGDPVHCCKCCGCRKMTKGRVCQNRSGSDSPTKI